VIQYERDLLIVTSFRFNLVHGHDYLVKLAKTLKIAEESAQSAWKQLNEWYENEDFVLWEPPHSLALAALNPFAASQIKEFCTRHGFKILKIQVNK
jgi:hypothetical protein